MGKYKWQPHPLKPRTDRDMISVWGALAMKEKEKQSFCCFHLLESPSVNLTGLRGGVDKAHREAHSWKGRAFATCGVTKGNQSSGGKPVRNLQKLPGPCDESRLVAASYEGSDSVGGSKQRKPAKKKEGRAGLFTLGGEGGCAREKVTAYNLQRK